MSLLVNSTYQKQSVVHGSFRCFASCPKWSIDYDLASFVSTNASSGNDACLWRSYPTQSLEETPCTTIALAACLTAAAPLYFPEVRLRLPGGTKASEEVHIDGGFGYNNPTDMLISEARSLWPGG